MVIRAIENSVEGKPGLWKQDWEPLENIHPSLPLAAVCSEDQRFLEHHGFDFGAIEKAMESNAKGRKLRGASTISQQTAKNVFLWPQRSWVRKGLESYFTVLIELFWSKERIMEVYLNVIEWGDGVYGAEAAARHWFGKSASRLTPAQSASLVVILPSPLRYRANPPGPYVQKRTEWTLRQMRYYGRTQWNQKTNQ